MGKENEIGKVPESNKKISRRKLLGGAAGIAGGLIVGTSRADAGGGGDGRDRIQSFRELPQTEINEIRTLSVAHIKNIKAKVENFVNPEIRDQYDEQFEPVDVDKMLDQRRANPYMRNNWPFDLFISPNRGGSFYSNIKIEKETHKLNMAANSYYDENSRLAHTSLSAGVAYGGFDSAIPELSALMTKSKNQSPHLPVENFKKAFNTVFTLPKEIEWDEPYSPYDSEITMKGQSLTTDGKLIKTRVNNYGSFQLVIYDIPPKD